ncbi:MAG TPA: Na+/H+ antiporter subunit E, partial [Steroidobacteraceae bacterium]
LLNNTIALRDILLGSLIAVLLMLAAAQMRPVQPKLRELWLAVPLTFVVLWDILRSNFNVARIVLGLVTDRRVVSGFIDIPLDLRDPHGLAILAAIITSTPGTAWGGLSEDGSVLKLHVLDLRDEQEWIRMIKQRYERPLMRIFG